MDNQEIPLLTEVYKTKPSKVTAAEFKLTPAIIAEIAKALRPQIEADLTVKLTETLTKQLSKDLGKELGKDLTKDLSLSIDEKIEKNQQKISDDLNKSQASLQALEKQLTKQPTFDVAAVEKTLIEKNQLLLQESKTELSDAFSQLMQTGADRMNVDIANKIMGMQELAVSQVKSKILGDMTNVQQQFSKTLTEEVNKINAIELDKMQQSSSALTDSVVKVNAEVLLKMQAELANAHAATAEKQKKAHAEELALYFAGQLKLQQEQYYQTTKQTNQDFIKLVSEQTNLQQSQLNKAATSMTEALKTQFKTAQDALYTKASAQIKEQLTQEMQAISGTVRNNFKQALNADLPEIEQLLSDKVNLILNNELPIIERNLMQKIKKEIADTVQSVKLVISK